MSGEDADRWHVRLAPGEVKVLTLDQIDDLFRLDMIDGDTLVRQEGAEQWLPLRVAAGLDDEASEEAAQAPPPPARSLPPPPAGSAPPARSAPPPPPAPLPPPRAAAPFAHSPSFAPPGTPAPSFAPPGASSVASFSVAPAPFAPPAPAPHRSRAEPLLVGLAALFGLVVALQRNGELAALFASAGQAAAYENLEASLGGPGFGTPRAVDALVKRTSALSPPSATTPP